METFFLEHLVGQHFKLSMPELELAVILSMVDFLNPSILADCFTIFPATNWQSKIPANILILLVRF